MKSQADISGIGLGCGRLRGGLEARASLRLIERALALGIRHFDVAPSYGEGAAESLLGTAVEGLRGEVRIVSKVGLPARPASALRQGLRAVARQIVKPVLGPWIQRRAVAAPPASADVHGWFDARELAGQLSQTLQALRTDYLDAWLLHEPRLSDPSEELARALEAELQSGRVRALGVGSGGPCAALPAFGTVAQCRVGRDIIHAASGRTLIVHGLLRWRGRGHGPEQAALLQRLTDRSAASQARHGELLQPALLAAALLQRRLVDKVLVSTTSLANLEHFVRAFTGLAPLLAERPGADIDAYISSRLASYDGVPDVPDVPD